MSKRKSFDELSPRWQQEFEADAFGFTAMLQCLPHLGIPLDHGVAGVAVFFAGLDLMERTICRFLDVPYVPDEGSLTHPPAQLRLDRIRELELRMLGPEISAGSKVMEDTLLGILESCRPNMDEFVD